MGRGDVMKKVPSLLLLCCLLQACQSTSKTEGIEPSAGNAVRNNVVAHVIDPWPREASQRAISFDARYIIQNNTKQADPPPAR